MASRARVVKDRTKAYKRALDTMRDNRIRVGILGEKADAAHKDQDGRPTPATTGEVAIFHEFGTSRMPMRSFIRAPIDAMRPLIRKRLVEYARRAAQGKVDPGAGMEFVGSWVASLLADGVRKGLPVPPLADSTKARRRGTVYVPLFDTGQLASSISHKVESR